MQKQACFIPEMFWNIDEYKDKNLYFHLMEVQKIIPNNACVTVQGYGEMLMFGSYSYLGLIGHPEISKISSDLTKPKLTDHIFSHQSQKLKTICAKMMNRTKRTKRNRLLNMFRRYCK